MKSQSSDATGRRPGLLLPGELAERRRDLDARADVALDVAEQDPTEFEPVRYLVSDYEILHRDMREVALLTGTLASSASRAEKTFAGLKAAARAPRGKRWKKSGCVSGEVRKSLETLGDRLAALDTERSALEPGADRPDLLARVRDLEQRYRALDGEVRDLWQRELPESWKARKVDVPRQWPIGGRRYNRPPIPDRSDTTWDSTSDFSSSGGDSHSGGDW